MEKIMIDATGKQCPIPVVMMKKALDEQPQVSCAEILVDNEDTCIRIPMNPEIRSGQVSQQPELQLPVEKTGRKEIPGGIDPKQPGSGGNGGADQ